MGLTIPTETHKGPWILKHSDFEDLETVIIEVEKYLKESLELEIIQTVEVENTKDTLSERETQEKKQEISERWSFSKKEKKFTLVSSDGKRLLGKSIREILKDPSLPSFNPKQFHVLLEYGSGNTVRLEIPSNDKEELKLDISCFDLSKSNDIRLDFNTWISKVKPGRRLRIWNRYGELFFFLLLIPMFIFAFNAFKTDYSTYDSIIREETKELLHNGIDDRNINQALELLMKQQTNYVPDDFVPRKIKNSSTDLMWFGITAFLLIVMLLRPFTTLGLGRNKWKIDFYKGWIFLVTVTVPSAIIAAIWDYIRLNTHL